MRKILVAGAALALAIAATTSFESDALACGGCFHPPTEVPTVVTDHRMILSVSPDQSTLYDQIKYTGAPGSFAWVLPISGTVDVGLSADIVFASLDGQTQTQIEAPNPNCPPLPADCPQPGVASAGAAADAGAKDGVNVLVQQVVGPYETVQLQASTPNALEDWLSQNGYALPADVKPIVDAYVTESFNFLALKLKPGAGVQDMRPVRVTTKGANVALPLRMVSAGTGATVGITLWVVAEGRYEPQNFPFFHVDDGELQWDWTQNKSNYTDLRAQKTQAGGGRAWEIESSISVNQSNLTQQISRYAQPGDTSSYAEQSAQQDYLPVTDSNGNVTKTAVQVRSDDLATLFHGIGGLRVTRLRGDIAHAALDKDLVMIASGDQGELSNLRKVTKEANDPLCPVYQDCQQVGTAPRGQLTGASPGGTVSGNGESFSCATANGSTGGLAAPFGFLAFALIRARRRRR